MIWSYFSMKTLSTCIRNAGSEFTNVLTLFLLLLLNSGILVDFILKNDSKYSICTYFLEIKDQFIFSNICVSRKSNTFPWVKAVKMFLPVASFPSWSQQMISNYFVKINVIDGTGWEVTYISSSWNILALQQCFIYITAIWRHSLFSFPNICQFGRQEII